MNSVVAPDGEPKAGYTQHLTSTCTGALAKGSKTNTTGAGLQTTPEINTTSHTNGIDKCGTLADTRPCQEQGLLRDQPLNSDSYMVNEVCPYSQPVWG